MAKDFRTPLYAGVGCAGVGALLFGAMLGLATIGEIRPRAVPAAPIYPRSAAMVAMADVGTAPDCAGCSTFDEGYRWASARRLTEIDPCFNDDWSYQRGCLAYVRARRLD